MKFSEQVFELAENFMETPSFVRINQDSIECLVEMMLEDGKVEKTSSVETNIKKIILTELIGSSINYCYWYGKSDIRPGNSSSGTMYKLLKTSLQNFDDGRFTESLKFCIASFQRELILHRFPLIEQRINHLNELIISGAESYVESILDNPEKIEFLFRELLLRFPGFSSDMFLKRASLFFIQLYRELGWFEKDMYNLHAPADYQIPKMLETYHCISYDFSLRTTIFMDGLIPAHSVEECEIRSATILVMRDLCKLTGWNISDVDEWLFSRRHIDSKPFHLTITTDY